MTQRKVVTAQGSRQGATAAQSRQQPTADAATVVRREPFTAQQLQAAWQSYIDQNPHEKVITTSMRTAQLQAVSDTLYDVFVEGQAQIESIESNKLKIMTHLRNEVGNDMLALELKVRPTSDDHRILTPREVVEDIKQRRPDFVPFIKDFELGLA